MQCNASLFYLETFLKKLKILLVTRENVSLKCWPAFSCQSFNIAASHLFNFISSPSHDFISLACY